MGQDDERAGADVIIGLIRWRGAGRGDGPEAGEDAEVIRLAPYLLARGGRSVAPPAERV